MANMVISKKVTRRGFITFSVNTQFRASFHRRIPRKPTIVIVKGPVLAWGKRALHDREALFHQEPVFTITKHAD